MRTVIVLKIALLSLIVMVGICHSAVADRASTVPALSTVASEEKQITPAKVDSREQIDFSRELGGNDPIEGFNRSMFAVNHFCLKWIFRPIGSVYSSIFPKPVIESFSRLGDNVEFPRRMFSCFLQAKFASGGIVFTRFMTNSTLGVGGLFDPADSWFGLKTQDEDFGQAFACWGMGPGCFIFLPGEGPTNVRDGVGKIFDYAFDPKTYLFIIGVSGAGGFSMLNKGSTQYADYDQLTRSNADPYHVYKDVWSVQRKLLIEDWTPSPETNKSPQNTKKEIPANSALVIEDTVEIKNYGSQGNATDTLRVGVFDIQNSNVSIWAHLSFFNTDFINYGNVRSVNVRSDKRDMAYKFWRVKDKPEAPLVILIPGLGGHYSNSTAAALAELLNNNGYAVAIVSNTMNWDFMESAASVMVPGFTPSDAADTRDAIGKIIEDMNKNVGLKPERIVLAGYSHGGLQTLFIAKMEDDENRLGIDRYLAINPPVNMLYSMKQVDKFFNVWHKWTKEEAVNKGAVAIGKYIITLKQQYQWQGYPQEKVDKSNSTPPAKNESDKTYQLMLTEDESKLLVGYSFKRTLEEAIVSIHHREALKTLKNPYSWGGRAEVYQELTGFDFNRYVNEILLPYYAEKQNKKFDIEQMNREASLCAIEQDLKTNPKIRVIHTLDDFLENNHDRIWLKQTLGNRVVFFNHGSHLGYLYIKQVHDVILDMLKENTGSDKQEYFSRILSEQLSFPFNRLPQSAKNILTPLCVVPQGDARHE
ncbi:MAG: MlaA family lipoprotein [Victivallaceae bacterium]